MAASVGYVLSQLQRWTSPRLGELSDAVLLERFIQRRDEAAFAALVARYGGMVLRSCRRVLGDAHEAEDAFQATFLILARQAHTLRQPAALPGFLHGIARRVALKARMKAACRTGKTPLAEELSDARPDPLAQLTARELLKVLNEEIARLPPAQRSAVVLCCLEGQAREEAANWLGCTVGSLKGHLERGRKRLQERLARRGIVLSAALALVAVSRGEAAPATLLRSTVTAVLGGGIGSAAAALAHRVLKAMLLGKLAAIMTVVLTVALAASATVALVYRTPIAEAPEDNKPAILAAPKDADAGNPQARTDALGDPLPEGAIARLGTVRFRHGGHITRVTFTPDGKRLLTLGDDGVRLWEAATGKELAHFAHGVVGRWAGGDLSPDGKLVAVSRNIPANGPIDFWDAASGKQVGSLEGRFGPPVRFSPDGKFLAACSTSPEVDIWDLSTRKKLRSWKAHAFQVWTIAFSADSRKLLTTGTESKARLWDVATGRQLQEFTPSGWQPNVIGQPPEVVLSPDGKLVALLEKNEWVKPAGWEARISLWDAVSGKRLRLLSNPSKEIARGYARPFGALTFSADSKRLITGGPDNFLRVWDAASGEELRRLPFEPGWISALALSRDGKTAAAAARGGRAICLVDMASGEMKATFPGHLAEVQAAALTPDGRKAITCSYDSALLVWDVATGRPQRLEANGTPVHSLHLTPDGRTLFSGGWDKTLRVWDLATGKQRRQLKADLPKTGTGMVHFSADGKSLVLVDSKQTIRLLDASNGEERQHFHAPEWILAWALTPDGRSLVGWAGDRKVRVWDVAAGRLLHEYLLPKSSSDDGPTPVAGNFTPSLFKAALSPDGRLLAVGSEEHPISNGKPKHFLLLMEVATGREVLRLEKVSSSPKSICFSPDGRMLAWGSVGDTSEYWWSGQLRARAAAGDAAVHLAETTTGRERRRLNGHRGYVSSLAFSASGDRLISGSVDTTALVWDLGHPAPIALRATEIETLWTDLAGDDAVRAYQAIRKLAAAANVSVPFFRNRLRPVPSVDEKRLAKLISDLDSDDFALREKTTAELEKLGECALPVYRKALDGKPTLESRRRLEDLLEKTRAAYWEVSGERLRSLRAVEVLELAGTKEARELLATLITGAEGARLTEQAKAALERLKRRGGN